MVPIYTIALILSDITYLNNWIIQDGKLIKYFVIDKNKIINDGSALVNDLG